MASRTVSLLHASQVYCSWENVGWAMAYLAPHPEPALCQHNDV